jgi:hypothetical protein
VFVSAAKRRWLGEASDGEWGPGKSHSLGEGAQPHREGQRRPPTTTGVVSTVGSRKAGGARDTPSRRLRDRRSASAARAGDAAITTRGIHIASSPPAQRAPLSGDSHLSAPICAQLTACGEASGTHAIRFSPSQVDVQSIDAQPAGPQDPGAHWRRRIRPEVQVVAVSPSQKLSSHENEHDSALAWQLAPNSPTWQRDGSHCVTYS